MAQDGHGELPNVLLRGPLAGQQPAAGTDVALSVQMFAKERKPGKPWIGKLLAKCRMSLESYEEIA
jgi:hypothetical protein